MSYSPIRYEDIQKASKTTDAHERERLNAAAKERGWTGGDVAQAAGIKKFNSKNDVRQSIDFINNWYSQNRSANDRSSSVVEARERAQQVEYSLAEQPKLFEEGTPAPGDSAGKVADAANKQGA